MDSQPDNTAIAEQALQEQLLAGVQGHVKQTGKIRDQLREMFNPDDYVTVANPFNHATGWVYVDPAETKEERPGKTTKRVTFGKPKTRILQPGQQVVIHGWEAYIALGRMFKEYAQEQGANMLVVLSSQQEVEKFLGKSYKGIFDPNAQAGAINAQQAAADIVANTPAPQPPATDPLGFEPEPPRDLVNPVEAPAPTYVGVDIAQGNDTQVEQVIDSNQQTVVDSDQQND